MRQKKVQLNPAIKNLPQKPSTWYLALRAYPGVYEGKSLFSYMLVDKDLQSILDDQFLDQAPKTVELLKILENAMLAPQAPGSMTSQRPMLVEFEQAETWQELAPFLDEAGIASQVNPQTHLVDRFLQQALEIPFDEENDDLLNAPGMTPGLAGEFFQAAAAYYRASPWDELEDLRPLEIRITPPGKTFLVLILGKNHGQRSLLFFDSYQDILNFTSEASNPLEMLPGGGIPHINFEGVDSLSKGDRAAIQEYNWEVAGDQAYPQPGIYTQDALLRPDAELLAQLTLCLKALQSYLDQPVDPRQDSPLPTQCVYPFETSQGMVQVEVSQTQDDHIQPAVMDDYALRDADQAHVQAAQVLSEQAWHSDDPGERQRLAREALASWGDCIQAHVVLGEEAGSLEEALEHFQEGIQAGKRSLDPQALEAYLGQYWQVPAARDLLMAIQGKVECLVALEEYEAARQDAQELLDLNTPDHQGMRYTLLFILFQLGQDGDISQLLDRYPYEISASWPYGRALLAYRAYGDSQTARDQLGEALQRNPHVPAYLVGKKQVDVDLEDFDSFGDESEAMHYTRDYSSAWWQTKGAIEWLKRNL